MIFFLKAKHWMIFSLIFLSSLFIQILLDAINVSYTETSMLNSVFMSQISLFVFLLFFFAWVWSVISVFINKTPNNVSCKRKKIDKLLIFILSYYLLVTIFMFLFINLDIYIDNNLKTILLIIIVPLHLFSLYSFYYILYFFIKIIKTVELQKEVAFKDFIGEFIMIIFFPIGIWFIQPKINEIYLKITGKV
jgi:hypothetical protein